MNEIPNNDEKEKDKALTNCTVAGIASVHENSNGSSINCDSNLHETANGKSSQQNHQPLYGILPSFRKKKDRNNVEKDGGNDLVVDFPSAQSTKSRRFRYFRKNKSNSSNSNSNSSGSNFNGNGRSGHSSGEIERAGDSGNVTESNQVENKNKSDSDKSSQHGSDGKSSNYGFLHSIHKVLTLPFQVINIHSKQGEEGNAKTNSQGQTSHSYSQHRRPPKVLLYNCTTPEEHFEKIHHFLVKVKSLHGLQGLLATGFDYIHVHCDGEQCSLHPNDSDSSDIDTKTDGSREKTKGISRSKHNCLKCCTKLYHTESQTFISMANRSIYVADGDMYEEMVRLCQEYAQDLMIEEGGLNWMSVCEDPTKGNPIRVLVDHQPHIAKDCCQREVSDNHDEDNDSDNKDKSSNNDKDTVITKMSKIAQLKDQSDDYVGDHEQRTLLITTGKGKVRAGIFSRQHLLVSSIESSTALPMVRDARKRGMRIAILDPNARGDKNGMTTYEQSMGVLFGSENDGVKTLDKAVGDECIDDDPESRNCENIIPSESSTHTSTALPNGPIYVLAHSASGSQLARYLMTEGNHIMSRIKSIAFTDSTHSIQWLQKNQDHTVLLDFIQSPWSLYIRSANQFRDDDWEKHKPGDNCETDQFWRHRFGQIKTIWAGTTDHSLTNWTTHSHIWEHFDMCHKKSKGNLTKR